MRFSIYAAAVVVGLSAASSATAARSYSATRTAACLTAAGAQIERGQADPISYNFPEIKRQFLWHIGPADRPTRGEIVAFTASATASARLVTRYLRIIESHGALDAEARRLVGSQANAVWVSNLESLSGLGARRTALLKHCLR